MHICTDAAEIRLQRLSRSRKMAPRLFSLGATPNEAMAQGERVLRTKSGF